MKTTKRAVAMFNRNKTTLVPAGASMRAELEKHLATLNERINSIGLAEHLLTVEAASWKELNAMTDKKMLNAKDDLKKKSLLRLKALAEQSSEKYADKGLKLIETKHELWEIRVRVRQAISMIDVENSLRNVTSMFEGAGSIEAPEINLEAETREIRQLLHATDGLMELMA